jgi:hypothetical protein
MSRKVLSFSGRRRPSGKVMRALSLSPGAKSILGLISGKFRLLFGSVIFNN